MWQLESEVADRRDATWGWRYCSKWCMVKLSNTYTYSRSFLIETLYTRTLIHSVEDQVNRLSMNVTCNKYFAEYDVK